MITNTAITTNTTVNRLAARWLETGLTGTEMSILVHRARTVARRAGTTSDAVIDAALAAARKAA